MPPDRQYSIFPPPRERCWQFPVAFLLGGEQLDRGIKVKYIASMPKVLEVNGYKFFFFSNEGNPLEPCHIHVRKAGNLAKLWVGMEVSVAGNVGFSSSDLREIKEIVLKNKGCIRRAWDEFFKR